MCDSVESNHCIVYSKTVSCSRWSEITIHEAYDTILTIRRKNSEIKSDWYTNRSVFVVVPLIWHFSHVKAISHYLFHAACALMQTVKIDMATNTGGLTEFTCANMNIGGWLGVCVFQYCVWVNVWTRIASDEKSFCVWKSVMAPWKWSKYYRFFSMARTSNRTSEADKITFVGHIRFVFLFQHFSLWFNLEDVNECVSVVVVVDFFFFIH